MRSTLFSEQKNNLRKHIDGQNGILRNKSKKFCNKNVENVLGFCLKKWMIGCVSIQLLKWQIYFQKSMICFDR